MMRGNTNTKVQLVESPPRCAGIEITLERVAGICTDQTSIVCMSSVYHSTAALAVVLLSYDRDRGQQQRHCDGEMVKWLMMCRRSSRGHAVPLCS
jgi:hypothetical protein